MAAVGGMEATPQPRFRRRRPGNLFLTVPGVLLVLVFCIAPLAVFFVYSFLTGELYGVSPPLTLENYSEALTSEVNRQLAVNSLVIGLWTAAITVALGLPIAYWLRYSARRSALPVLLLITASLFASYLVRIYAWRTILGDNGLLNSGLQELGLIEDPLGFVIFSRFAVIVALVHIFLPYVVLVLYAGFGPMSPALLEASQDLGANAPNRWRRIILPLMAAPAVTAFLFVFVLSASDYVTPQLLGGSEGVLVGVQVQTQLRQTGDWALGAATSFLMLGAFITCYIVATVALRRLRLDRIHWS